MPALSVTIEVEHTVSPQVLIESADPLRLIPVGWCSVDSHLVTNGENILSLKLDNIVCLDERPRFDC